MKKIVLLAVVAVVAFSTIGCNTTFGKKYAEQTWTPDSFSYEAYLDNRTGRPEQHGVGLNWNLKPGK